MRCPVQRFELSCFLRLLPSVVGLDRAAWRVLRSLLDFELACSVVLLLFDPL